MARAANLMGLLEQPNSSSTGPRERLLLDFDWKFFQGNGNDPHSDLGFGSGQGDFSKSGDFAFAKDTFDDSKWRSLNLPHDWGIELPFVHDDVLQGHGYKPLGRRYPDTSVGWYRRVVQIPKEDKGRCISVEFDGVFRDALVFLNGFFIGRNNNGYCPFHFDITDYVNSGGPNFLVVRVDASLGDGWFYEGAGIYRHVWLLKTDPVHLGRGESYIRCEVHDREVLLHLGTVVQNQGEHPANCRVRWRILDPQNKQVAIAESTPQDVLADGETAFTASVKVLSPELWSPETPSLYKAEIALVAAGKPCDAEAIRFGVRTVRFDEDKGFLLNGKQVKIKGTCNHQDHAGVGVALPDRLQRFRLAVLKDMGSNAVRTSHNMPTPEWVEACDRMGMMMLCETRLMGSTPEGLAQLETMIKRFRNSPSIILWGMGNEEWPLQGQSSGHTVVAAMVRRSHELDPTRLCTAATTSPFDNSVSTALDVQGFNYSLKDIDAFRKAYPHKPLIGTETASTVSTRGIYSTDKLRNWVSSYDLNHLDWSELAEEWWKFYAQREWLAGGFAWTGFDYRGEPTPYGWPSVNSQFGIVDTCGFPKDNYFYYKAWWGATPVLHLLPHWNWEQRRGEPISVWVQSNLEEVELFLNGVSQGRQKVPLLEHVEWSVKYEPGILEARGMKAGIVVLIDRRETTGSPTELRIVSDRMEIDADGQDVAMLRVEALDGLGRPVPTADMLVNFKVSGEGALIGVGNGDPNCQESDKESKRSLFNGLAQVIVQSTRRSGSIVIEASSDSPNLKEGRAEIKTRRVPFYQYPPNTTCRRSVLPVEVLMKLFTLILLAFGFSSVAMAQALPLERNGQTITIEPYAPNVVRVTLSLIAREAVAGPGFGFVAKPEQAGWAHSTAANGADIYKSPRMTVTLAPSYKHDPNEKLPDTANFFSGSVPGTNITITLPDGSRLLEMDGWQMAELNQKDDTLKNARGIKAEDLPLYTVGASFVAPDDEHYYGLGQNQEGYLDHRQRPLTCAANYLAPASPSYCVPFLVTNKGYGVVWDNPSSTTVYPAFDGETKWTSTLGRRVSFFVIAGATTDEIYSGYRLLTGSTPMLPKSAYGFIQCKQRYSSQAEVLGVAKGYRDRHLPLDVLVVDWFYYTKMGEYDFDSKSWPNPAEMNRKLHEQHIESMISVWPRFAPGSRYYDFLLKKGWFEHYADGIPVTADGPAPGKPVDGLPYDKAGSDIDTTNPEAARWWWNLVRDNIAAKGFDYFWADETEPDLPPDGAYLSVGPGTQYFNVYPLFHTAALYDGVRRDKPQQRNLTLSRDAYLGAQRNGTIFWSSDISPTWDTLRRQIPTGLNVAASGIAYTGNDIGGWQGLPWKHTPVHPPLIDPSTARDNVGQDDDYPELYVRWFEYGTFLPTMRTHGTRRFNEVWTYGTEAEPILEKYLKLRYTLMPYIYSLGWFTHQTGAPFMRALFMDFPNDPQIANLQDEYMFGPALLVAPVVDQGATAREVYLPAGTDWYNYWTNEKFHGGQKVTVNAPIDTIPLFVRAGSILPMGAAVESTYGTQAIEKVKVYAGADGQFVLYSDDGTTYAYEKGKNQITTLQWNDASGKLTQEGAKAWEKETGIVEVVR